jgi:hypothetical protein
MPRSGPRRIYRYSDEFKLTVDDRMTGMTVATKLKRDAADTVAATTDAMST